MLRLAWPCNLHAGSSCRNSHRPYYWGGAQPVEGGAPRNHCFLHKGWAHDAFICFVSHRIDEGGVSSRRRFNNFANVAGSKRGVVCNVLLDLVRSTRSRPQQRAHRVDMHRPFQMIVSNSVLNSFCKSRAKVNARDQAFKWSSAVTSIGQLNLFSAQRAAALTAVDDVWNPPVRMLGPTALCIVWSQPCGCSIGSCRAFPPCLLFDTHCHASWLMVSIAI